MVTLSAIVGLITHFSWGIISDNTRSKYGRRRPFLLAGIIGGIAMILFAFSRNFAGGDSNFAYTLCLILDVVIIGISSNSYYTAERVLVPDSIDIERRGRANGIVSIIGNLGLIIAVVAFMVADMIWEGTDIASYEQKHIFLLSLGGGAFIICGLLGFFFVKEKPVSELPPRIGFVTELKELLNIKEFKKQKEFFKIIVALTVFRSGIMCVMPYLFIYIEELNIGVEFLLIGILVGFISVMVVMSLLGKLTDKYGRKKFIPLIIIITSIGYFFIPLIRITGETNTVLFIVLIPFLLIGILGLLIPMNTWSQDLLPDDKRGKFYGILNIIFTVSQVIGSFIGAAVAQYFAIDWIFIAAPIFFLGSIPLFLLVKETLVKEA